MFSSKKAYSSITVYIENMTSEDNAEDDLGGIPDLVEVIKLQPGGPTEASRAIRKKLKYGNVHRQLRALTILDALIKNAGETFQRTFADEMLLERLRVCGSSDISDPKVKAKCARLFLSWQREYGNTNFGSQSLKQIAALSKQLPQRKKVVTQENSRVLRETEDPFHDDDDDEPPVQSLRSPKPLAQSASSSFGFGSSSAKKTKEKDKKDKKDKKGTKAKAFNLEAEKETMKKVIADSDIASTNLMNTLRLINREKENISDNRDATLHFKTCKALRRQIWRYIQHIETEPWLGHLLTANDRVVDALLTYENLDSSIDADSDSDDEMAVQQHLYKMSVAKGKENETASSAADQLAGLSMSFEQLGPPQPPRPMKAPEPEPQEDDTEVDENDPFSDSYAVETPAIERSNPLA